MTEYEAATLAARHTGLWIAAAQVGVGLLQAAIVWYGIRAMQRAGDRRAREQDQRYTEAIHHQDQRHDETMRKQDQRHDETMRLQDQRHDETMRQQNQRHHEAMRLQDQRHDEAMTVLRELISRTGSPADARPA